MSHRARGEFCHHKRERRRHRASQHAARAGRVTMPMPFWVMMAVRMHDAILPVESRET